MERKSQDNLLLLAKEGLGVAHAEKPRLLARCNAEEVVLMRLESPRRLWNNKYLLRTITRGNRVEEKISKALFGKQSYSAI